MMKKYLVILIMCFFLQNAVNAQMDFVLNNPVMGPTTPAPFPGMLTITFDFYVAQSSFTFSSDELSNNYATITYSFTKLNPTAVTPSGTGAVLFNWVLTNNGGVGVSRVYTYTGKSKSILMNQSPPASKYKITFANVPITFEATQAQSDVRVAGQFTDPGIAPTGLSANNSSSIATYTAAGSPLPLQLLSFDATKQANSVLLNWQTSSEIGTSYFDVEFSKEGNQWQSIGNVTAAGTSSSVRNYNLTHFTPVNGANYYRLRLADNNGRSLYSVIRVVTFNLKGVITILPNPTVDMVYVTAGAGVQIESIRLFNLQGQQLRVYTNFISGSSIDMSTFAAGTYVLKILDKLGNQEVRKVVKQD